MLEQHPLIDGRHDVHWRCSLAHLQFLQVPFTEQLQHHRET